MGKKTKTPINKENILERKTQFLRIRIFSKDIHWHESKTQCCSRFYTDVSSSPAFNPMMRFVTQNQRLLVHICCMWSDAPSARDCWYQPIFPHCRLQKEFRWICPFLPNCPTDGKNAKPSKNETSIVSSAHQERELFGESRAKKISSLT